MISFQGGDAGRQQAVRVTWSVMPPGWESWQGTKMFVQQPWWGSEVSGTSFYLDAGTCVGNPAVSCSFDSDCGGGDTCTLPPAYTRLLLAELDCTPYYRDWSTLGAVNVIHEGLVSSKLLAPGGPLQVAAAYDVQFLDFTCAFSEGNYGVALETRTAAWGDPVALAGGTLRTPDDKVTVADTLSMQAKFTNQPGSASKASMSLLGVTTGPQPRLDGKITVSELVSVLSAFSGQNYPFAPKQIPDPPAACPP